RGMPWPPPGGPPGGPPGAGGGPPGGPPGAGGPPGGPPGAGGPPPGVAGGPPGGAMTMDPSQHGSGRGGFSRVTYMEVKLHVEPDKSTGIFAGATGEMEIEAPDYRSAGHLIVNTDRGDLFINFLEGNERGVLSADMTVDGERST